MTQSTLVEIGHHNLQTALLAQMEGMSHWETVGVTRRTGGRNYRQCQSWRKYSKPRPDKLTQRAPKSSSQPRRRDTLGTEVKSLSKTQSVRKGMAPSQACANKRYSFKDDHVVSLFKLLQKSNKLKLPEIRRLEEVGKIDNLSYCLYHRMLEHPTKNCYIFKDDF